MFSEVIIDDKKYVILPKEAFEALKKKQIMEMYHEEELLNLEDAKARTLARIEKWAK